MLKIEYVSKERALEYGYSIESPMLIKKKATRIDELSVRKILKGAQELFIARECLSVIQSSNAGDPAIQESVIRVANIFDELYRTCERMGIECAFEKEPQIHG